MKPNSFKISFLGASGVVTGSKYLLEILGKKILVDCGLFQGGKELRSLNWDKPKYNPSDIDFVLLTHGHLDHTGYLPRLVKLGFKGNIYATYPTLDVAEIILKDTGKIQEKEAEYANKKGYSSHKPALAFYNLKDVEKTISFFKGMPQSQWITLLEGLKVRFQYNGHILGATFIELDFMGKRIVFSGDIGRTEDLLLYPPKRPKRADILLMESTYGGRLHQKEEEAISQFTKIANNTIKGGGSLYVPSFSVERAQLLMYIFWKLQKENKIPKVQMIMDSPEGADILELFFKTREWHKLDKQEYEAMCNSFEIVSSYHKTLELRDNKTPKIVIAGSGMLTGGRILNYLETEALNPNNTLLFVGYQAEGSRGRKLLEGERVINIFGKKIDFHMKVEEVSGLSAHADDSELIHWLQKIENRPKQIFLVHGEIESASLLKTELEKQFKWNCKIPNLFSTELITFD